MKVKDLIEKLQQFDPELPVAIADWNEEYRKPSEPNAEVVNLCDGPYCSTAADKIITGSYVCIGG